MTAIQSPDEPTLEQWFDFIELTFADSYGEYAREFVRGLIQRRARVIFDVHHLSRLTGYAVSALNAMTYRTGQFYRRFTIPKRRGGVREICSPLPSLLTLQRWMVAHCLQTFEPSPVAHGFVKGCSVSSNARPHLGARCVLKLDIENFFPSIDTKRVIGVFQDIGYDDRLSFVLARLCTLNGSVPQGAATSPTIANRILHRMDTRLAAAASYLGLVYTRYADDLTFSGPEISLRTPRFLISIIENEGFEANTQKSRLMRGSARKIVTGVSVGSGRPRLPREMRRALRAEAFWVLRRGILAHVEKRGIRDPQYLHRLISRVAYWGMIETDRDEPKSIHARLLQMHGELKARLLGSTHSAEWLSGR